MPRKHDFIAELRFRATAEGGRKGPTGSEWFGCPLEFEGAYFDCLIDLSTHGSVGPGDQLQAPFVMLCPELVLPRLLLGAQFTLWEGRTVASGNVVEILWSPDFLADIRFYGAEDGGRQVSTRKDTFCAAIVFEGKYHDCWLDFSKHGTVRPGEQVRVPVTLCCSQLAPPRLEPGSEFTLWERGTIASGTIVQVLPQKAS